MSPVEGQDIRGRGSTHALAGHFFWFRSGSNWSALSAALASGAEKKRKNSDRGLIKNRVSPGLKALS
jgi:hypothetical protein